MKTRRNGFVFLIAGAAIIVGIPIQAPDPAVDSIQTLTTAEADFRGCDRDWNHVNDFWTSNMTQLYSMTSATIQNDQAIPLIELSSQAADESHGCHVNDFWSSDVKGIYPMTSAAVLGSANDDFELQNDR